MLTKKLSRNIALIIMWSILIASCKVIETQPTPSSTINFGTQTLEQVQTAATPTILPTNNDPSPQETRLVLPTHTITTTIKTTENPIASSDGSIDSQYFVVHELDGELIVFEINSGYARVIALEQSEKPLHLIKITDDGCAFIVEMIDKSIVQVAIAGANREVMLPERWYPDNTSPLAIAFSSSEEWLAYVLGSGYQDYDSFEKQELFVYNRKTGQSQPVSENGGVWDYEWAPNNLMIAYSDFDANGVQQIFTVEGPLWAKRILTTFSDPGTRIENITWSPEGDGLAFTREEDNDVVKLFVVKVNDRPVELSIETLEKVYRIWWQDNKLIGVFASRVDENQSEVKTLVFVDTSTGELIDIIGGNRLLGKGIALAAPLSNKTTGFFSEDAFNIYDLSDKSIREAFPWFLNIREWLVSPSNFSEEKVCSP